MPAEGAISPPVQIAPRILWRQTTTGLLSTPLRWPGPKSGPTEYTSPEIAGPPHARFFGALSNIRLKQAAMALSRGRRAALSADSAAGA